MLAMLIAFKEERWGRSFERYALKGRHSAVGVEVGVFRGAHAQSLIRNGRTQTLYLIDPYEGYDEYPQDKMDTARRIAERRLRRYCVRFVHPRDIKQVPEPVDYAYIDGNHAAPYPALDIATWWPRVRTGGVLGGHDYDDNGTPCGHPGVMSAVLDFVQREGLRLYHHHADWWVYKEGQTPRATSPRTSDCTPKRLIYPPDKQNAL